MVRSLVFDFDSLSVECLHLIWESGAHDVLEVEVLEESLYFQKIGQIIWSRPSGLKNCVPLQMKTSLFIESFCGLYGSGLCCVHGSNLWA